IVPFRDEVINGAPAGHAAEQGAGVAEGNAAIHAAGGLFLEFFVLHVLVKLEPIANALAGLAVHRQFPEVFNESSRFSHVSEGLLISVGSGRGRAGVGWTSPGLTPAETRLVPCIGLECSHDGILAAQA